MVANTPWSGWANQPGLRLRLTALLIRSFYNVTPAIWAIAHTSQFTRWHLTIRTSQLHAAGRKIVVISSRICWFSGVVTTLFYIGTIFAITAAVGLTISLLIHWINCNFCLEPDLISIFKIKSGWMVSSFMIYALKFMENAQYLTRFLRFKFYTEATCCNRFLPTIKSSFRFVLGHDRASEIWTRLVGSNLILPDTKKLTNFGGSAGYAKHLQ